ncbi:MAG: hypothetical protein ACLFUS_17280 [Candidatus Sumerlaeia bacterium]
MSTRSHKEGKELEALDRLVEEITVDTYGDDEQLWAFRQAFEDEVALPVDGFVIGEPVSVITVDYDGNQRRGLTANCRREDGSEYVIAVSEVVLPQASAGAPYIAAYRRWLNLDPYPVETKKFWVTALSACCRGAWSTTVRFCVVCTAMDCVSGVSDALTRRRASFKRCYG